MIRLSIAVDSIDDVVAQGYTVIRVYTNASATSANFATLDGTVTLVAEQTGYTYVDTDGDTSTYYKIAYYGATPGVSTQTPATGMVGGTVQYYASALDIRQELAAGDASNAAVSEADDDIVWDMCEEASRLIDEFKRVEPGAYLASGSETRYFAGSGWRYQPMDLAVSVSAVAVEETDGTYTTWTQDTDYYLWPYNYSAVAQPVQMLEVPRKSGSSKSVWIQGPKRVKVTGVFGVSTAIPATIRRAARIQVARWYKRAQQGWQDTAANVELGQLTFTRKLDPDVETLLRTAFPTKGAGF